MDRNPQDYADAVRINIKGGKNMITDKIMNVKKYPELSGYADEMLAFVERVEKENLEDGRYDLLGENLFALLQSYETKKFEDTRMETHKIYNDLQYVIQGEEIIYWSPVDELTVEEDRTPEADVVFYKSEPAKISSLLTAGMFGVYFPWDGHRPSVAAGESAPIRKIVFKFK